VPDEPSVHNRPVLYHRMPRLLENRGLARGDGRYAGMLRSLARVQVLILDDRGITPLTADQRRDHLITRHEAGKRRHLSPVRLDSGQWHNATVWPLVWFGMKIEEHRLDQPW
jgi:hypothetical protein